jgi:hypothetical protein
VQRERQRKKSGRQPEERKVRAREEGDNDDERRMRMNYKRSEFKLE